MHWKIRACHFAELFVLFLFSSSRLPFVFVLLLLGVHPSTEQERGYAEIDQLVSSLN